MMARSVVCAALTLCSLPACTSSVFDRPVTVSTTSDALEVKRELGEVWVEACDTSVLLVPVAVADPGELFDELLRATESRGGNGVVDVQSRYVEGSMVIPFYTHGCTMLVGKAVVAG